ncbi:MAG: response regulator [Desulfarculaceae bacterium]|nr:response regulator [Desulfarculaceae bacterium]MCF8071707.1 response regulator [Desulfarculaceae bacterium]MCF8102446.1 response regulator [Desulfarculaceae bacterium]MCF8116788.1 response regulator [Desulfarculaceae bacterium]
MTNSDSAPVPVLVIDDERDIRDGCQRILSRQGCSVDKAPDGAAGLEAMERSPADIVLLDLKMPGMDGLEVLKLLRQSHPQVLVIVITGYATVETAIEAMKLGAYDFLPKPFQPDQLRLTVGRAMERLRLTRETERLERERRQTLADLAGEQSRLRTVISALPLGILVTQTDGQVVLHNPTFCQMAGLEPDSAPGQDISRYLREPKVHELARRASQQEQDQQGDPPAVEFTTDQERTLLAQATPVLGEGGASLGAVLVFIDVTPYRMLDQLRQEFVAKVSHELRSPLSTILLQLTLLLGEEGTAPPQGHRHLLSRARERTQGLISFVRDLLDLSRLEDGGATAAEPVPVSPGKMLAAVKEALSPQAQSRGMTLSLELPEEPLPLLLADPVGVESVFTNLAANAINYSPDGGRVTLKAWAEGGMLKVTVSDEGFGIEPEKVGKIFDRFYRIKNEKTRYVTGTGLGLPIVKSVVDSLGGTVEVDSELGKGSSFTVTLPVE